MVSIETKGEPSGAILDDDYRYLLWRDWSLPSIKTRWCLFFMLNPSTADHTKDDPTIRRCLHFAKRFDCNGLLVVNLFALRSTDPGNLREHPDPVGPLNDDYINLAVDLASVVVCAWGTKGDIPYHAPEGHLLDGRSGHWSLKVAIMNMRPKKTFCLGRTKAGYPRHPLYVRNDTEPTTFPELAEVT